MLYEFFEYVLTRCPYPVKAMGFLREAIGIRSRYRRCRTYWADHIERTRSVIRQGMERSRQQRKAVILGAGLLHDIPLPELSARPRRRRFTVQDKLRILADTVQCPPKVAASGGLLRDYVMDAGYE